MSKFNIYLEDALDHYQEIDSYESYEECKKAFEGYIKDGPEGYDLSITIEEIIGDYEDMITHDFHQWFTQEEWIAAHPSGFPD